MNAQALPKHTNCHRHSQRLLLYSPANHIDILQELKLLCLRSYTRALQSL